MRFFIYIILPLFLYSNIIINEVMSNVKGIDSGILTPGDRNEFVELYNNSNDSVNITLLKIADKDAVDYIIPWNDSLIYPGGIVNCSILPPHKFAIILDPEYIDSGDGEYYMPYNIPQDCYVFTVNNTTIGNGLSSADYILLLDENDSIIDSYGTPYIDDNIPYDPGDGISVERINPLLEDKEKHWKSCVDSSGNTIGRVNSTYMEGIVIDTISVVYDKNCNIMIKFLFFSYNTHQYLFMEKGEQFDSVLINDSIIQLQFNRENDILNIFTKTDNKKYSILLDNIKYKNTLIVNEFMLHSPKWIELYNPYKQVFFANNLKIINNDTILLKNISIPADSYIVISEDTNTLKGKYIDIKMNLFQNTLPSLPKRIDTILLSYMEYTIDSIIRGYEDYDYRSIERVCENIEGYILNNWDISTDQYKATPSYKNSLYRYNTVSENDIFIDKNIITRDNPIIFITIKTLYNNCYIYCSIYNQLGELIEKPYDNYLISGNTIIPCKLNIDNYNNDIYILYINIKTDNEIIEKKIPFAIRK